MAGGNGPGDITFGLVASGGSGPVTGQHPQWHVCYDAINKALLTGGDSPAFFEVGGGQYGFTPPNGPGSICGIIDAGSGNVDAATGKQFFFVAPYGLHIFAAFSTGTPNTPVGALGLASTAMISLNDEQTGAGLLPFSGTFNELGGGLYEPTNVPQGAVGMIDLGSGCAPRYVRMDLPVPGACPGAFINVSPAPGTISGHTINFTARTVVPLANLSIVLIVIGVSDNMAYFADAIPISDLEGTPLPGFEGTTIDQEQDAVVVSVVSTFGFPDAPFIIGLAPGNDAIGGAFGSDLGVYTGPGSTVPSMQITQVSPPPGTALLPLQSVQIAVLDLSGGNRPFYLERAIDALAVTEKVWDGTDFGPLYKAGSSGPVTQTNGSQLFTLVRAGGQPAASTFEAYPLASE